MASPSYSNALPWTSGSKATNVDRKHKDTIQRVCYAICQSLPVPRGLSPPGTSSMLAGVVDLSGKIKLGRVIGGGGFGKVHMGTYRVGWRKKISIAIKVLNFTPEEDDNTDVSRILQRMGREAHVWHNLSHKNVLKFLGVCSGLKPYSSFNPIPALVSVHCSYGTVVKYLTDHPETLRFPIVFGVARGLHYLHSNEIIHGDIKPNNILISEDGEGVLADFGRSRIIGQKGFTTHLASSLHYTAPELQMTTDDNLRVTKPSDIFSFAVTTYRIFADKEAFDNREASSRASTFFNNGIRPLRETCNNPEMSDELWDIIERAWQHDPSMRLDANQLIASFEAAIASGVSK